MDLLATRGELGLVATIPPGMPSGSDVGTMTMLGYDPARYHTGRAPIEAASQGIELAPDDVVFRMNLVSLKPGGDGALDDGRLHLGPYHDRGGRPRLSPICDRNLPATESNSITASAIAI